MKKKIKKNRKKEKKENCSFLNKNITIGEETILEHSIAFLFYNESRDNHVGGNESSNRKRTGNESDEINENVLNSRMKMILRQEHIYYNEETEEFICRICSVKFEKLSEALKHIKEKNHKIQKKKFIRSKIFKENDSLFSTT
jgi:hypothetical protein